MKKIGKWELGMILCLVSFAAIFVWHLVDLAMHPSIGPGMF